MLVAPGAPDFLPGRVQEPPPIQETGEGITPRALRFELQPRAHPRRGHRHREVAEPGGRVPVLDPGARVAGARPGVGDRPRERGGDGQTYAGNEPRSASDQEHGDCVEEREPELAADRIVGHGQQGHGEKAQDRDQGTSPHEGAPRPWPAPSRHRSPRMTTALPRPMLPPVEPAGCGGSVVFAAGRRRIGGRPMGGQTMRLLRALQTTAFGIIASTAWAQVPAAPAATAPAAAPEAAVAPDSPRASMATYLDLSRARRFDAAARFLILSGPDGARGPELARRLKAVLDRHLWVDLDSLSPLPGGRADDGLPALTDELGAVPGAGQRPEPVRIARVEDGEGARWAFSHGTVARIEGWYAALGHRWMHDRLPEVLLRPGPRELLWWQWLALPFLGAAAWGAGRPLGGATIGVLRRLFARTRASWDDALLERWAGPLVLAWTLGFAYLLLPWLDLTLPAQAFLNATINSGVVVTIFWSMWRSVDILGSALSASPWGQQSASARSVLSIGVRGGKVGVLGMGLVAALAQLGYPVASLLAGLGLGGLALALAAQKTVEHLFGSISLAVDQPFRVGDFVKIEDFVGTVEAIGLRSTRFRTLDRTLISIPNGRLSDMRLESYTARDRMRLACTVGLVYGARSAQVREVIEGLERVLRAHPRIWPDALVVRFKELATSSLDIEVMAWFETPDWSEFQRIRQDVLLQFMDVVERAGTSFAFPTRTVHVVRESSPATG